MDLKISENIKNTNIKYYADAKKTNYTIKIDCSDGENPYGCSKKVMQALNEINDIEITNYSYDNSLKKEIAKYWNIKENNVLLCCGSVEGLYYINQLFKTNNATLLTFIPHFPNFSNHAKMLGYKHKTIPLDKKNNYKYDVNKFIKNIDESISLIYIDTPNNPTGQILEKNDAIQIIEYAEKLGIGVIIDEAYGDYLKKECSCIDLVNRYENLIVIRTFSKGFGLAGIRAGYIISSEKICGYLEKMLHPYNISQLSRKMAIKALEDKSFIENCINKTIANKKRLKDSLNVKLKMASTHESSSICMLYCDEDIDLCQKLAENGVKVYSGLSFDGLGKNCIRLNLPKEEQMNFLIDIINKIKI